VAAYIDSVLVVRVCVALFGSERWCDYTEICRGYFNVNFIFVTLGQISKQNTQITKELKITPILDKLLEYKRSRIQHINRVPRNRLPSVMKHHSAAGRRNHGRPLKRLLDT